MSWIIRVLVVMLLPVQAALAAPIPVSSGEHEGFTRLVFEGQDLSGWRHEESEDAHRITFARHSDGFATDTIYQYIRKDRVQAFNASATAFEFQLGCDCNVEVFALGKGVLVVDVSAGVEAQKSKTAAVDMPFATAQRTTPFSFGARVSKPANQPTIQPAAKPAPKAQKPKPASDALVEEIANLQNTPLQITPPVAKVPTDEEAKALQAFQEQLLKEVGAASSRGVLVPNANFSAPNLSTPRPQVDPGIFDSSAEMLIESQVPASQIRITSSADTQQSSRATTGTTTMGVACLDPEQVDVMSWSNGEAFDQQLGEIRRELFGEFDELNKDAAVKMARLYIHFGFGAEASSTLSLIEDARETWPELIEMAQILDYGHVAGPSVLAHHQDCNSSAALWGILASESIDNDRIINIEAALFGLNSLPIHLRKFLSPELSNRLLRYGDRTGAKNAMRNLERLDIPDDDSTTLAKADLELSNGRMEEAESLLNEVVNSNSQFSAQALISLIETEMESGRDIDVATANLVEAYAMEQRDAPIGKELRRVHVLALAQSGQFDEAFAALQDLGIEQDVQENRAKVLKVLVEDAEDAVFLNSVYRELPNLVGIEDPARIMATAERLLNLGFSETAEKLLVDANVPTQTRSQKILRAQIALDLGRAAAAEAFLIELDGPEVTLLRARASEQNSNRVAAHEMYQELDQKQSAQHNAWLSEQWKSLTPETTPVFGELVGAANQSLDQPQSQEGMKARTQNLLEESSETRALISSILNGDSE